MSVSIGNNYQHEQMQAESLELFKVEIQTTIFNSPSQLMQSIFWG